jgi:hypothetical protein
MSTRRHVDDLFTGALDGDLSPIDEARFHAHLQSCSDCSAAFTEFTATVEALHELPKARMARVVHLPSTPPVAEESPRGRLSLGWLNPGMLLRRFPATAVAGAVAVVLVIIALTHGSGAPTTNGADQAGGANSATAPAPALDAACGQPTAITESSPPAQFAAPQVATNVSLPGVRLVLAASRSQWAVPGGSTADPVIAHPQGRPRRRSLWQSRAPTMAGRSASLHRWRCRRSRWSPSPFRPAWPLAPSSESWPRSQPDLTVRAALRSLRH